MGKVVVRGWAPMEAPIFYMPLQLLFQMRGGAEPGTGKWERVAENAM